MPAFDTATTSDSVNWITGTSTSWSHQCTGTNMILLIGVFNLGANTPPTTVVFSGGTAKLLYQQNTDGNSYTMSIWGLLNPTNASGQTISVFWPTSISIGNAIAASYTNVDQNYLPKVISPGFNTGTSLTTSLTTAVDNCMLAGYYRAGASTQWTNGTNGTIRNIGKTDGAFAFADSNVGLAKGTISQTLNRPASSENRSIVLALRPAGAPELSGFFSLF